MLFKGAATKPDKPSSISWIHMVERVLTTASYLLPPPPETLRKQGEGGEEALGGGGDQEVGTVIRDVR